MADRSTTELAQLARTTIERLGSTDHDDQSLAYAQLVASELYESLQRELRHTPRTERATRGMLAAAADQCRRSADAMLTASQRLAELQMTLAVLESEKRLAVDQEPAAPVADRPRWPFRVIEGGLSRTA